jgi:hypothetical protein
MQNIKKSKTLPKDNMPKKDKEVIITNPKRNVNTNPQKTESYQPEYVRLGLDPIKPAKVPSEDFQYAFGKRKPFITSSKKDPHMAGKKPHMNDKLATPPSISSDKFPSQIKISSGFNHEHTWRPTAAYYDEETIPIDQVSKEDVEEFSKLESVTFDELESKEKEIKTKPIKFDEVEDETQFDDMIGELSFKSDPIANKQKKEPDLNIDDIKNNQYCVIVRGVIVRVTSSLEEIEHIVESILFNEYDQVEDDVSVDDIIVFKRLSIKAGVVIKE